MDRRLFLKEAGLFAAASSLTFVEDKAFIEAAGAATLNGLSICQGATTSTTTQLSVDLPVGTLVAYSLVDKDTGKSFDPVNVTRASRSKQKVCVDKVVYVGLELGHQYRFQVIDTKTKKPLDERFLSTVDLNKEGARVGLLSCMRDSSSSSTIDKMWASAQAANVDYMLFIGDNVYGDTIFSNGPDVLWGRYVTTRQKVPFYRWKSLKPVVAVWDDHDFGKNNEDGNYKHKAEAMAIFEAFFAQDVVDTEFIRGPGNAKILRAFDQNFLFFDNRTNRMLKNSLGYTGFLGVEQIDWASSHLGSSTNATWVMQGTPFFGRTSKGSYQTSAKEELAYLASQVKAWNAPIVFAAGDLHYTELSEMGPELLGYKTYELISSSMHSMTKSKFYDNPHTQIGGYLKENFMVLQKNGAAQDYSWDVTCVGANSTVQFQRKLSIG